MIKKKLLFYVHVSSHLKASFKLIQRLQTNDTYEPVVFLNSGSGWNLSKDLNLCKQNNIQYILDSESEKFFANAPKVATAPLENPYHNPEQDIESNGFKGKIKSFVKNNFPMLVYWNYCRKRIREFRELLEVNQIHAVILPEDAIQNQAIMVRAARMLKRPSILIPWAKCNHEDVIQLQRTDVKGLSNLFCKLFPKWKMHWQGVDIMPLELSEIIPMELLKIAPHLPFLRWGGRSDVMLVENDDDAHFYGNLGLRDKMIKTGAIYQDIFFDIVNQKDKFEEDLYKKYNITDQRPVVLCNLFPVATSVDKPFEGFDYASVREAISFWLDPLLRAEKFQVWVNHHPRTTVEFVKYLEDLDLKVMYEPIEDILPLCDLYVTGVSATTRMALTLAKPQVCLTEIYVYTDLDNFKSVCKAATKTDYLNIIKRIDQEEGYFNQLKRYAIDDAKDFGPLDGGSYNRILQVFNSLN